MAWKGDVSSLEGEKVSLMLIGVIVTRWLHVEVDLEDFDVMPITDISDLWEFRYYIENVILWYSSSIFKVVMAKCNPFHDNELP